jgi:nucleoside-diphosphate-sugar epimerase
VAEIVREQIPGARIEIGSGLSEEDRRKSLFRGRLDVEPARRQLGYEPRFADLRGGVAEYIAAFRTYLAEAGSAAATA